ncbi:hypothetical protein SMU70_04916 [Streptococcus mutans NLML5]|nr:hypothetical protein SMU70_04916 [Streptococcus mutans NLML5]
MEEVGGKNFGKDGIIKWILNINIMIMILLSYIKLIYIFLSQYIDFRLVYVIIN